MAKYRRKRVIVEAQEGSQIVIIGLGRYLRVPASHGITAKPLGDLATRSTGRFRVLYDVPEKD